MKTSHKSDELKKKLNVVPMANIHQTLQSPVIWDGYPFFINNGNALYVYGVDLII